jgi:signal transduction histidine kinase
MTEAADLTSAPLVLYVDDERPNRVVFEQSLKSEFRIKTVGDGRAALELMTTEDVAVLVTDIRMPEMDGLELLRHARERHPNVLRMVITAYSDLDPILRAINEGMVARYIVKPFERDELEQVLRWATELWTLQKNSPAVAKRMLELEKLATLGSLTAHYLHDVRNPLMSLTVSVDHLQQTNTAQQNAELAELVHDIAASTSVVTGMLLDLWGFVQSPKAPQARPAINPVPVIGNCVTILEKLSVYANAKLAYIGPSELPQIRMSPIALTQVLLNLVGNAAQAVIARKQPGLKVSIDARPTGDMVEVEIRDEGVGMSPEVLKRVGTPFFTTRAEGTGLGISNVQRLIGAAGGRMKIESEQDVGTTVTLLLPIAQ